MSKNISVKVGGVSRNFSNVPKIQTEEAITGDNINWIPEDEANDYAVTETLRITQNGTYHPSSGKCGFSEVVANVSGGGGGTLIEKNITANGDYYATDDQADGYSKVSVNIVTPINYVTQAEYDALTLDQKIELGFIIIRDEDTQLAGVWYDYSHASGFLLPYSVYNDVVMYSEALTFDGVNPWGTGIVKVNYNNDVEYDSATASVKVYNKSTSGNAEGVADLSLQGGVPDIFTVYAVCACDNSSTTFGYILSVFGAYSLNRCPVVACDGRNEIYRLQCGIYATDRDTTLTNMQNKFFACAIKVNRTSGACKIFINDYISDDLPLNTDTVYRYIHLAIAAGVQRTDSRFKFVGAVVNSETDTVVQNNVANLRLMYGI